MNGREQITPSLFDQNDIERDVTKSASRDLTEDELIDIVLHHWYWKERRRAARYLANHTSKKTIDTLICVVRDDRDEDVVEAAVLSLLKLRAFEALDMLTKPKVLSSTASSVRWAGTHALGDIGNSMHFGELFTLTHDPDWLVRNEAVTALDRLISQIGETISPENQSVETINLLIRMLRVDRQDLQEKIVDCLMSFNKETLEDRLIESLNTQDEHMKVGITTALGKIKSHNAVPYLVNFAQDAFISVRKAAIHALAHIGGHVAINAIIQRLGDGDDAVVQEASQALIAQGDTSYVQAILIDSLQNIFNVKIRKNILFIMGRITHPSMIVPILEHLGNSYFFIRASAKRALIRFGDTVVEQLAEILSATQLPVDTLIEEALHSSNLRSRLNAIASLSVSKNSSALETAKELSQDEHDSIADAAQHAYFEITQSIWERANATYVLGELGNTQYVPLLIDTLKDESTRIRTAVLGALEKIREERAIDPVAHLAVFDPDERIRTEAVSALVGIGSFPASVKAVLLQALNDEHRYVRFKAARGLAKIPDDDVIDALLGKLGDSSLGARRNVLNALYTIGEKITPKVKTLLQSTKDKVVKREAIILLGVLFIRESVPLIESHLEGESDPELIQIGKQVLQVLKGELKDTEILFKMYLS